MKLMWWRRTSVGLSEAEKQRNRAIPSEVRDAVELLRKRVELTDAAIRQAEAEAAAVKRSKRG